MMGIPASSFAVAAFVVIALPGFIYAAVSRRFRGEAATDRDVALTVARGAVFAVTMTAFYLAFLGAGLLGSLSAADTPDSFVVNNPKYLGGVVLILYVAVPAIVSLLLNWRHVEWSNPAWTLREDGSRKAVLGWVRYPRSRHGYSSMPSAWDHAASENHGAWVRVRRSNGEWVGGWYTAGSFATTYPEPRSIYIARQYVLKDDGTIVKPEPNTGVFLSIGDDDMVFWTNPKRNEGDPDER
ncbi:DUF6338 family protein [Microbacterium sp. No. 7]|uniref:DUF6338 family protein n=1 Tax=Microbacterium sp. No. 7 TaxID=1714373 RepID=UPI003008116F